MYLTRPAIGKLILYFSLVTQFIPAFFMHQYDVSILLIVAIVILLNIKTALNGRPIYLFIIYLLLVALLFSVKMLFVVELEHRFEKSILSDVRPMLLLIFAWVFIKKYNLSVKRKEFFFVSFLLIAFLSIPNIVGLIDGHYYRTIHSNLYSNIMYVGSLLDSRGEFMTVSSYASLQGRLSSIFLQPAAAGILFSSLAFIFLIVFKASKINRIVAIILFILCFVNGYVSGSTVVALLPFFVIIAYLNFTPNFILLLIILLFASLGFLYIFDPYTFNIFDQYIFGGRFISDGNIATAFSKIDINLFNILFGIDKAQYYGKGFGDSGYLIKFALGGVVYLMAYFTILFTLLKIVFNNALSNFHFLNKFTFQGHFSSLLLLFMLSEIGFTAFSQVHASFITVIMMLFLYYYLLDIDRKEVTPIRVSNSCM